MGLLRDVLAPAVSASASKVAALSVPAAAALPDLPETLAGDAADESAATAVAAAEDTGAPDGQADVAGGTATVRSHRPETIATSWRGLVDELLPVATRKNLLGE
ncbi:hypothetical protein [Radicibacter daui]|uniref:hypothetical protein n=1 Tax=Radicibacter daui TaxID=3064829 RepID=UPI004046BABE